MGLDGLYGIFGGIAAMDVGRDKLVLCFPCVFNGGFEVSADFIVKDLEVNSVATVG
jgi:hypothetical protein